LKSFVYQIKIILTKSETVECQLFTPQISKPVDSAAHSARTLPAKGDIGASSVINYICHFYRFYTQVDNLSQNLKTEDKKVFQKNSFFFRLVVSNLKKVGGFCTQKPDQGALLV